MKIENGEVQVDYGIKSTVIQVALCILGNSALLSSGMTLGFTAVALPYMIVPNDVFHIDKSQASWIASLAAISTPLGCLASGPLIDRFGRKIGLLFLNIPALIGWLCIAIQPTLVQLYIGRVLTGFACGLSSIPATVYIAECATASLRGFLVTGTSIAISLGVAIVYIMGLFIKEDWQFVAGLCSIFPVISFVLIATMMPESPVWLITRGKNAAAGESLKKIRGTRDQTMIQQELDEMIKKAQMNRKQNGSNSLGSTLKAMTRPESYKPLFIMNAFFFFQQLTGIFVVIFYAVDVVREAGVTTDPFVVAVLIGLTRLFVTIFAAWMSKRLGRRPTAIISGIGMTISLAALSAHLYFQHGSHEIIENTINDTDQPSLNGTILDTDIPEDPSMLPIISILLYILSSTVGFLTLPWAMIGEVYPAQIRGVASGLTTCIAYIISFAAVKLYPTMLEQFDKHGVFFFYGLMAFLGTIFVFFFLPETQGKSLSEIEAYFAKPNKNERNVDEEEALNLNSTKLITIVSGLDKNKA